MTTYSTNALRAALGLLAGVVAGAVLIALWNVVSMTRYDAAWFKDARFVFVWAAVVWAVALIVVGTVPWAVLHHYKLRSWPVAVALGGVLTFLVVFGFLTGGFGLNNAGGNFSAADTGGPTWVNGVLTPHGWFEAFRFSAICTAIGAIVGFVVWRTAYRRVRA